MSVIISLKEVRDDMLEKFCTKYNWIYPILDICDKEYLYQELSEEDRDYYCKGKDTVILCVRDEETGNVFR